MIVSFALGLVSLDLGPDGLDFRLVDLDLGPVGLVLEIGLDLGLVSLLLVLKGLTDLHLGPVGPALELGCGLGLVAPDDLDLGPCQVCRTSWVLFVKNRKNCLSFSFRLLVVLPGPPAVES